MESNFLENLFGLEQSFPDLLNNSDSPSHDLWLNPELQSRFLNSLSSQNELRDNTEKNKEEQETMRPGTKRRRRKPKDEATLQRMRQRRAERNRRAAKASRERTRTYIQALEREVLVLRQHVEIGQCYLMQYAMASRMSCLQSCNLIKDFRHRMSAGSNESFISDLKKCYQQKLEAKRKALERLTREIVEMTMPLSVRLVVWLAEKNADCYSPEEIAKSIRSGISLERAREISNYFRCLFPQQKNYEDARTQVSRIGVQLKKMVKDFVECQRKIQLAMKEIENYISSVVFPALDPQAVSVFAKLSPELSIKPEFSNLAMYDLTDTSFTIDETPANAGRKKPPFVIHTNCSPNLS